MKWLLDLIQSEPVVSAATTFAVATVGVLAAFGLSLTQAQYVALGGLALAGVALTRAVRAAVSPVSRG
jgi:hypothetical protein